MPGTALHHAIPIGAPPVIDGRAMLLVAHPDDETIGAGAALARAMDVLVVHLTDGAPRIGTDAASAGCDTAEDYAALRRRELGAALALAGVPADRALTLGYSDQAASLHMAEAARRVAGLIVGWRPARVLTHPYEGGHPDHDAAAFAAHAALALLRRRGRALPDLAEMAFYHDGDADGVTTVQEFLPVAGSPVHTTRLDEDGRALKRRMLAAHASQAATLAVFRDDVERWRPAPLYDFTRPPHAGRLNYERFDWGMDGERWRTLAAAALAELALEGTAWR